MPHYDHQPSRCHEEVTSRVATRVRPPAAVAGGIVPPAARAVASMQELTWLLLPAAAFGGWFAATRLLGRRKASRDKVLSPEYLKGLNYLLNQEPDKAIDVFTRMLELTADSPETQVILADQYLKLGVEFRRRGEVDRAIRIHQELVSREFLGSDQRTDALFELAQDYFRAGILGRAEELFLELAGRHVQSQRVLPMLLEIYQQEKDWENAIKTAGQLQQIGGRPVNTIIAHYYCEMAEAARERDAGDYARELLRRALEQDSRCARANILLGDLERKAGRYAGALAAYCQVADQDIERLPQVLDSIRSCHEQLGSTDRMHDYLRDIIPRYAGISPVLMQAEMLAGEQGAREAADFMTAHLGRRPSVRGFAGLIEFGSAATADSETEFLELLRALVKELRQDKPLYSCHECGFAGKTLHWQCPGCRQWDSVRPIHGVEGD